MICKSKDFLHITPNSNHHTNFEPETLNFEQILL